MGFDALLTKVKQAEEALEAREREAVGRWQQFSHSWRAAWTPGRIVVVGLVSGFVAGRTQPIVAGGGGGLLALVRTFAPLLAGLQAGAQTAEAAKEEVHEEVHDAVRQATAAPPQGLP